MLAVQGRMIVFLLLLPSIEIEIDRQEIISIFGPRRQENSIFIFKDSRLNTSIVFYYFRDDCSGITYIIIEMSVCLSDYSYLDYRILRIKNKNKNFFFITCTSVVDMILIQFELHNFEYVIPNQYVL